MRLERPQDSQDANPLGLATLSAAIDGADVREDSMQGRNYLVAPVVAIVEGVLFGQNSETPELALASVFGAHPEGWNGRPVVMNHPQVDGTFVSANDPSVIDDWAFGQIFAARVEDNKLKVEAWIDIERADELGGEFASTLQRLRDKEMVEVSVGVFVELAETSGVYEGKDYGAVWTTAVPDHLALLSKGVLGACSCEDGCGAPRVNSSGETMANKSHRVLSSAPVQPRCNCGGTCGCNSEPQVHNGVKVPPPPSVGASNATPPAKLVFEVGAAESAKRIGATLSVNALPKDRFNHDIYKAVARAVYKEYPYSYCMGYTDSYVVYERYTDSGYAYFKVGISVNEDLEVTFTGDPVEINLVTSVIEVKGENNMTVAQGQEPTTENQPAATVDPAPAATTTTTTEQPAAPTVAAAPAKPLSVNEYIASAPAEVREVLSQGMTVLQSQKETLATALLATNRCKFTKEQLLVKSIGELQDLATLAGVDTTPAPLDYSGRALPRTPSVNAQPEIYAPDPVDMFARSA